MTPLIAILIPCVLTVLLCCLMYRYFFISDKRAYRTSKPEQNKNPYTEHNIYDLYNYEDSTFLRVFDKKEYKEEIFKACLRITRYEEETIRYFLIVLKRSTIIKDTLMFDPVTRKEYIGLCECFNRHYNNILLKILYFKNYKEKNPFFHVYLARRGPNMIEERIKIITEFLKEATIVQTEEEIT